MCGQGKCGVGGCTLKLIVKILLIVGGVNWGLVGVGMLMGQNFNIVNMLLGAWPEVEAIVYILVGLAAVMKIFGCCCKKCKDGSACGETCGPKGVTPPVQQ